MLVLAAVRCGSDNDGMATRSVVLALASVEAITGCDGLSDVAVQPSLEYAGCAAPLSGVTEPSAAEVSW